MFASMPTRTRSPIISPLAWIKPELAALVKAAPKGTDWLHEMKLDGYRMHARLDAGHVQILTRRGNDWTQKLAGQRCHVLGEPPQIKGSVALFVTIHIRHLNHSAHLLPRVLSQRGKKAEECRFPLFSSTLEWPGLSRPSTS